MNDLPNDLAKKYTPTTLFPIKLIQTFVADVCRCFALGHIRIRKWSGMLTVNIKNFLLGERGLIIKKYVSHKLEIYSV